MSADPPYCTADRCVQIYRKLDAASGRIVAYGWAINYRQLSIKLSNEATPPASGDLAEVEPGPSPAPGKDTATLRATVYDSNNQPQPGVSVTLHAEAVAMSGGHSHHSDDRPKGSLGGPPPTARGRG